MPDAPAAVMQRPAINGALAGLFDYAGIFPPAEQELQAAVQDYLAYQQGRYAWTMGSLVISVRAYSETGMMHGFINLLCASALVWFGGEPDKAVELLEEQDPQAWRITTNTIQWRSSSWSAEQLRQVRVRFLISIGSCSFSEPMNDLVKLGWL